MAEGEGRASAIGLVKSWSSSRNEARQLVAKPACATRLGGARWRTMATGGQVPRVNRPSRSPVRARLAPKVPLVPRGYARNVIHVRGGGFNYRAATSFTTRPRALDVATAGRTSAPRPAPALDEVAVHVPGDRNRLAETSGAEPREVATRPESRGPHRIAERR